MARLPASTRRATRKERDRILMQSNRQLPRTPRLAARERGGRDLTRGVHPTSKPYPLVTPALRVLHGLNRCQLIASLSHYGRRTATTP